MSAREPLWFCHQVRLSPLYLYLTLSHHANPVSCRDEASDGALECLHLLRLCYTYIDPQMPDPVCASCRGSFVEKVAFQR